MYNLKNEDLTGFVLSEMIHRGDLANIVRRRGYKFIRELLADSTETESTDIDGNVDNCIAENHDAIDDGRKDIVTGQYMFLLVKSATLFYSLCNCY